MSLPIGTARSMRSEVLPCRGSLDGPLTYRCVLSRISDNVNDVARLGMRGEGRRELDGSSRAIKMKWKKLGVVRARTGSRERRGSILTGHHYRTDTIAVNKSRQEIDVRVARRPCQKDEKSTLVCRV